MYCTELFREIKTQIERKIAEGCHTKQMDDKNQQLKFHVHKCKLTQ